MTCLKFKGPDPNELKVISWNFMGSMAKGWSAARQEIVKENIRKDYDMMFLQEVPWTEKHLIQYLEIPVQYTVAGSICKSSRCYILYKSEKLQECQTESDGVAATVAKTVEGHKWIANYSNEVCIHMFTLKGRGDQAKFVAISLHAPKGSKDVTKAFLGHVRTLIGRVVDDHGLPVLVGGDFNTDDRDIIDDWKKDRFIGLNYDSERRRIDYITMKVPEHSNYLEMAKVKQMKFSDIVIPQLQGFEVKEDGKTIEVQDFRRQYEYRFFGSLCDHHMPLTVGILVKKEVARADGKSELQEMEEQHRKNQEKIKHLLMELLQKTEEFHRCFTEMGGEIINLASKNHQLEENIGHLQESQLKRPKEGVSKA